MTLAKYILYILAIVVGLYHFWLTVKAIFVFRNNEPLSLWVFTLTGPLSTLPASIVGIFDKRIGGAWLVGGAVVSFVAAIITAGPKADFPEGLWFLRTYSGPMFVLGIAFMGLHYWQQRSGHAKSLRSNSSSPTTP
jgi:hypothetical protein